MRYADTFCMVDCRLKGHKPKITFLKRSTKCMQSWREIFCYIFVLRLGQAICVKIVIKMHKMTGSYVSTQQHNMATTELSRDYFFPSELLFFINIAHVCLHLNVFCQMPLFLTIILIIIITMISRSNHFILLFFLLLMTSKINY